MRSGRSRNGDGLTCECRIVNGSIKAVGGSINGGNNSTLVCSGDEVSNLLRGQSRNKRLDLGGVFVAFLNCNDVCVCGVGAFDGQRLGHGVQTCFNGVVGVDDRIVNVLKDVGNLCSFDFLEGDVLGVFSDVHDGSGDAGAFLELDDAVCFEQEQSTCFIGGIVGDSDFKTAGGACGEGQSHQRAKDQSEKLFHGFFSFYNIKIWIQRPIQDIGILHRSIPQKNKREDSGVPTKAPLFL